MSTVLVFGGAGFIGSHTCQQLRQAGYKPVVFDNLSEGYREFVQWGEFIFGDIRDSRAVSEAISRVQPDAIIHFAAFAYVGESVEDPQKYYSNNVIGSLNIIEAARKTGNIPIIFSSTCAIYGMSPVGAIDESLPKAPINPYGRSKWMVEQFLSDFSTAYGLRSVCLRYFNAAGADASGAVGEAHREETHLIPRAILAGRGRIDALDVFGNDYPTKDGTAVRDYIHVTDLAEAHVAACRYLLGGGKTDQFNVGVGRGYSVLEIITEVSKNLDRAIPYIEKPRRAGDPPALIANPEKAMQNLSFQATHSSLENIISTAVTWHQKNWVPTKDTL